MVEYSDRQSLVFRALADPTRRAMIERLSETDTTVSVLAEPLAMSLAAASKHIGVLERAGIVVRKKRGRERVVSLRPKSLVATGQWLQRYSQFRASRLTALDAALDGDGSRDATD